LYRPIYTEQVLWRQR